MAIGPGSMLADPWSRWRWGGSVKGFLRGIKSRSAPHRTCSVAWRLGSGCDMCWPTARVRRFQRRNATCLLEGRESMSDQKWDVAQKEYRVLVGIFPRDPLESMGKSNARLCRSR
ncbi:hypothetical protein COCVIDRAFT_15372 [Bipolaris victoriae FI3]|uniref:Uncharacterized protein n=1 Tax=Bipolaris victoriae (strain FI3) TaxID=930091 RepID=W7EBM0_BIPV3|nr:hypothetical protein COCVIDRAFT_15372 [Bipolaris victoriae FI3]